ncbi:MAG: type III pantothenate kinase, partial [Myxococcales bacterium]|nr:type III pantothenate kinase [Myxococcales bacterium]
MSPIIEIKLPGIGDFEDVEVIEVLVSAGDRVDREDSLITLESDKASIEIPSPQAGVIRELWVERGSRVSEGSLIARLEVQDSPQPAPAEPISATDTSPVESADSEPLQQAPSAETPRSFTPSDRHAEVVVIGGGPGGYTAAFRAADLGKQVVLIERYQRLGGVCLNVGCIPSKALLHIAEVVSEVRELHERGVDFGEPRFDLDRMRAFKDRVVDNLTQGLDGLANRRKISVLHGHARFSAADQVSVETGEETTTVSFDDCIIAAGSQAVELPGIPHDDPRVMDSTDALLLEEIPERLLVIGGGIIGLEMAAVYDALGSKITVVELTDELIPGCDRDLVKPLQARIARRYERILLGAKVTRIEPRPDGLEVYFEGGDAPESDRFDRVLVAVGRHPNGLAIDAGNTNTVFAVYDGDSQRGQWRATTDTERTSDEYAVWLAQLLSLANIDPAGVGAAIISSVVPEAVFSLRTLCQRYYGCEALIVNHDTDLGIAVAVDNPHEVGSDRLVNTVAAYNRYGGGLIVIDFGTATTFDIVGADGAYTGGVIAPGINLSLEALHLASAQL